MSGFEIGVSNICMGLNSFVLKFLGLYICLGSNVVLYFAVVF